MVPVRIPVERFYSNYQADDYITVWSKPIGANTNSLQAHIYAAAYEGNAINTPYPAARC